MKCQHIQKDKGALFVILPRPCVDNSRYLTHHHFTHRVMATLGYSLTHHHASPKLIFYHFTLTTRPTRIPYIRRTLLNDGATRNNFAIIIRIEPPGGASEGTESDNKGDESARSEGDHTRKKRKKRPSKSAKPDDQFSANSPPRNTEQLKKKKKKKRKSDLSSTKQRDIKT